MAAAAILLGAGVLGLALGHGFERAARRDWTFALAVLGTTVLLGLHESELAAPLGFWLWTGVFFFLTTAISWIDWKSQTILDGFSLTLGLSGLSHIALKGGPWLWFLAGAALVFGFIWLLSRVRVAGVPVIGVGDAGLMAGLALWLGPVGTIATVVWAAWCLSFLLLIRILIGARGDVPLAPLVCLVAVFVWVYGPLLLVG